MPSRSITVEGLLKSRAEAIGLPLELLGGGEGLQREIASPHIQKTGLALAGFYKLAGIEWVRDEEFGKVVIPWQKWVDAWEQDARGEGLPSPDEVALRPARVVSTGTQS